MERFDVWENWSKRWPPEPAFSDIQKKTVRFHSRVSWTGLLWLLFGFADEPIEGTRCLWPRGGQRRKGEENRHGGFEVARSVLG